MFTRTLKQAVVTGGHNMRDTITLTQTMDNAIFVVCETFGTSGTVIRVFTDPDEANAAFDEFITTARFNERTVGKTVELYPRAT